MADLTPREREWAPAFLEALEAGGTITAAARAVKIGRRTVYDERDRNPAFDQAVRETMTACVEAVEATLYQRAISGESDNATIFFLKTRKPEVYGDHLRAEQIAQIKAEARREVIAELQREIGELTPQARKLLMNAIPTP